MPSQAAKIVSYFLLFSSYPLGITKIIFIIWVHMLAEWHCIGSLHRSILLSLFITLLLRNESRGPEQRVVLIWLALWQLLGIWLSVGVQPPSLTKPPKKNLVYLYYLVSLSFKSYNDWKLWIRRYLQNNTDACLILNFLCIFKIWASKFHPVLKNMRNAMEFLETQFQNVQSSLEKIHLCRLYSGLSLELKLLVNYYGTPCI